MKVLILRHGKPAAAIVPSCRCSRAAQARTAMTLAEAQQRLDELAAELAGDPATSAVKDLIESRR